MLAQRLAGEEVGPPTRRRQPALALVAASLALGLAGAARAQTVGYVPEVDWARPGSLRAGPLWLTPRVELRNAGVDTNVFNERLSPIPDTSVVVRPSLTAALPWGTRVRLSGGGFVDLNYFARETSERSVDFGGEGRAELRLGPFSLFGACGGGQFKQRYSIDLDERLLHQEAVAQAGLRWDLTRFFSATFIGTGRRQRFAYSPTLGTAVKENQDRDSLVATVELRYALTPLTALLATGDAIEDRFPSVGQFRAFPPPDPAPASALPALNRTRSYRALGGFELGRKASLTGRILAGLRVFPESQAGGLPAYQGLALSVRTLAPLPHARGNVSANVERDVLYAAVGPVNLDDPARDAYVSLRVDTTADLELAFGLSVRPRFLFEQSRYLRPYGRGPETARRQDNYWQAGGSLLRRFGDSFRAGGTVEYVRRVSNIQLQSFEGWRYGLQAEYQP
jgi:hypothetical protein